MLSLLFGLTFLVGVAQATVVNLTNQYSGTYDPTNDYVPVGVIGPQIYSFQFFFSDPEHSFEVTLQAPGDLIGILDYTVTSGLNALGLIYFGGALSAGQTDTFDMGLIPGTSPEALISQALSIRALGVTTPYPFGGESGNNFVLVNNDLATTGSNNGSGGTGTGNGDGSSQSVPIVSTLPLAMIGGLTLLAVSRRKKVA